MTRMVDSGEFFFFALDGNGSATTFNADLGRGRHADRAGLQRNLPRILRAATTEAQYRDALARFRVNPDPPGTLLNWVCRDDERLSGPDCGSARNDAGRVSDFRKHQEEA